MSTDAVQLDTAKLASISEEPQQQLYVLAFLSTLESLIDALDADGASAHQIYIKKELLSVIQLSAPSPTRLIRNVASRCFAGIFGKGDRKLLFDTINDLLALVNAGGKGAKEVKLRHAAVCCLGAVFGAAGDSAVGLSAGVVGALFKTLKNAGNHCGLRASCYLALGKVFMMVRNMADEGLARDVYKSARNAAAGDKAAVVQTAALQCLEDMASGTSFFQNHSDWEKLFSSVQKALDSPSALVRKTAASCLANALVQSYSTDPVELNIKPLKRTRTAKKRSSMGMAPGDEDITIERPESPAPSKKAPMKLAFALEDILRQLSTVYVKSGTSAKTRAGLALCYTEVVTRLGTEVVEAHYGVIANHLLVDLLSHAHITANRFRQLTTRKYVGIVLEEVIGKKLLGESGQLNAIKSLVNEIIKNYPQVIKEKPEPSKHALTGALHAISSLIGVLGSATAGAQEAIRDGILQVMQHPSYTVQITASWCLKAFVLAVPSQLLPILTICMNNVDRELKQLAQRKPATTESFRRCTGYANGLAAAISSAPVQPLYASVDVTSRILSLATSLLKSSRDYDLRISSTQIQVAWILIGGLMSLGPNFVKIHLSQLLLLWKNALPKPLAKDSTTERSMLELSFLAHVRECALGSILSFLEFNPRLLTTDVSKRIAAMLQNSSLFLNTLPQKKTTEEVSQRLHPALQLVDLDLMVRRRVLQCYVKLVNLAHGEAMQANLLTMAISFFADPEKYTPSSLSTAIASSAGNFESLWEIGDNYAYGVCGFVNGYDVDAYAFEGRQSRKTIAHWMTRDSPEAKVEETLHTPVLGAMEHDSVALSLPAGEGELNPDPPATAMVNSAIDLFTILLPMQGVKVQESILEQIVTFLGSSSLQRDPGRKAAITVNTAVALLGAVKLTLNGDIPSVSLSTPSVLKVISEMVQGFVVSTDPFVRNVAYETLGRLCSIGGNTYTGNTIKWLVDTVVNNRDPNARAGSAVALGCVHSHVGGMAAGYHLKTIVGILMSLSNDPHPTVHFWALDGLARTIDSAGLTFGGYVTSTLGMLSQLYVAETHNAEVSSVATSNLELELPTQSILVRCLDSLIGVLGPDLQDMSKAREIILTNVAQFLREDDYCSQMEALRCLEHLSMFAGSYIDFIGYIKRLQKELSSPHGELRDVAIDGMYQLMKADVERIIRTADPGLEDLLWVTLDENPAHNGIRNMVRNWLSQTATEDVGVWIDRCQTVMAKTVERKNGIIAKREEAKPTTNGPDLGDEEVAGFAAATPAEDKEGKPIGQEQLRWQVRTFAVECLSELLSLCAKELAQNPESPIEDKLVEKIGEIIKMAFSASTSNVVDLRLEGLKIIDQVLKMFGHTPDPDFPEAPLLEQYQAQIGSALTPAFAADSRPELASEAVNVCAGFISTGIVRDVERMGRILKLLTAALENFATDSENASIGDLKGLSSNAQVMVKMAVLRAWAELQVASLEQKYLGDVVRPHIMTLAPMWLSSLREFARLRFEPDISSAGAASLGGSMETIYAALNRETLLKFYQDSWLKLVDAIASLIEQDSQFVFDALDGKPSSLSDPSAPAPPRDDINYRDEPVAFFFVLFGIAFEALVSRPGVDSSLSPSTPSQTLEILLALKKILHPSVCGHAIYQEVIFSETMDLLDRLVLTEGLQVQLACVEIARGLCTAHPAAVRKEVEGEVADDIDQLFELTRLIVLVLAGILPNLVDRNRRVVGELTEEKIEVVKNGLDALVDAAEVFPRVIRMDLYACILHIFTTILGTTPCQATLIPRALPIFKRFIAILTRSPTSPDTTLALRRALSQILQVHAHALLKDPSVALPSIKNCLMAETIILTAGVNILPANDPQVGTVCERIWDAVLDRGEWSVRVLGVGCVRSVLCNEPKSAADREATRVLVQRVVRFVAGEDGEDGGDEKFREEDAKIRMHLSGVFPAFLRILSPEQKRIAMALFIPALLKRAPEGEGNTAARILEIAGVEQGVFRDVVAGMGVHEKGVLQEVLVKGQRGEVKVEREERRGMIELKMDFGA